MLFHLTIYGESRVRKMSLLVLVKSFQWTPPGVQHESCTTCAECAGHSHTHTAYVLYRLGHCSSRRAVAQAGAVTLVRDLECGGNHQAGRSACCKSNGGGRQLVGASVLEQDVNTLLTPSTSRQSQRRLPLSVPIADIKAILVGWEKKEDYRGLVNTL